MSHFQYIVHTVACIVETATTCSTVGRGLPTVEVGFNAQQYIVLDDVHCDR